MKRPVVGRAFAALASLLVCTGAWADYTIEPAAPTSADLVRVRMDFHAPCDGRRGSAMVDLPQKKVLVTISLPDTCNLADPEDTSAPRPIEIGQLPAGFYTFEFVACVFVVPPDPPCAVFRTESVAVYGASQTIVGVPATSRWGVAMSVLALVGGALLLTRGIDMRGRG